MTRRSMSTRRRLAIFQAAEALRLVSSEQGQGTIIPPDRRAKLEDFCCEAVCEGVSQKELVGLLGACRSRISRWTKAGILRAGRHTDRRLINSPDLSDAQKMWHRIDVRGRDECWLWRGVVKPNGYGSFHGKSGVYQAHRLVFETLVAPIPAGMVVDPVCSNRGCVNPSHLQVVSHPLNMSLAFARKGAA